MESSTPNPILNSTPCFNYDRIRPAHFVPAMRDVILRGEQFLSDLHNQSEASRFEDTILPFIRLEETVLQVWTFLTFYIRVISDPEIINAYESASNLCHGSGRTSIKIRSLSGCSKNTVHQKNSIVTHRKDSGISCCGCSR